MIYFVQNLDNVKIGYTDNPRVRIYDLQVASPFPLSVLLIIDGGIERERFLHKKFKEYNVSGEWFELNEHITNFIQQNMEFDRRYEFGFIHHDFSGNEQIKRLRTDNKYTMKDLADKLGVTPQSVHAMQESEKNGTISLNLFKRIADVTGYVFEYRFIRKI